jgi:molecular chaperone GrpE
LITSDATDKTGGGIEGVRMDKTTESDHVIDVFPRFDTRSGVPKVNREQFRLEAAELFKHLRNAIVESLDINVSEDRESLPINATVSVPGLYDSTDRMEVAKALEAVGITDVTVVRAPAGTVASHIGSISHPSTVVAVEIGDHWCSAAVVEIDPDGPSLSVQTRVVESGFGRSAIDSALAERIIKIEQGQRNYSIEPEPEEFDRIQAAAHDAVDDLLAGDQVTLSVSDINNVRLGKGRPPISIEQEIDETVVRTALGDIREDLQSTLETLTNRADLPTHGPDGIFLAGTGTVPTVVRETIGSVFQTDIPNVSDPWQPLYQPAFGAAYLSALPDSYEPIERETTAGAIGIRLPNKNGDLKFREVAPPNAGTGETYKVELKPVSSDQTGGILDFATRHQATGELNQHEKWGVFGLSQSEEEPQPFTLSVVPESGGENIVKVEGSDAKRVKEPPAPKVDIAEREWFISAEMDAADLKIPESETDLRPVEIADPVSESFDEASPRQILETLLGVRYELWKFTGAEDPIDPSDLEDILGRYDTGLRRINVDIVSPEVGEEKDPSRHMIWDTEPSSEPDGSILRVRKPGYEVDGYVENPAQVIVSKGEPEPEPGQEKAESEPVDNAEKSSATEASPNDSQAVEGTADEKKEEQNAAEQVGETEAVPEDETDEESKSDESNASQPTDDEPGLNMETNLEKSTGEVPKLSVEITDENDDPLEEVHVEIRAKGETKATSSTGESGRAIFKLPTNQKYRVVAAETPTEPDGIDRKASETLQL